MTAKRIGGWLVVGALLVAMPSSARAHTSHLRCGQTIIVDTVLANDLSNCPGAGIVIGADGVTLDLNGHKVDGDGAGGNFGIDNSAGHDGVTVRDGSVREFGEGVMFIRARRSRLLDLVASDQSGHGIFLQGSPRSSIARNTADTNLAGIIVVKSGATSITHNAVAHNQLAGIGLFGSNRDRVVANSSVGNVNESGVAVYQDSDHNTIADNTLRNNAEGINIATGSDHEMIRGNSAQGGFDGVLLSEAKHNAVVENSLQHNEITGIGVFDSDDNVIDRNSVLANGDGSEAGIHVSTDPDNPGGNSDRNLIKRNRLANNVGDGILVGAGGTGNAVKGNRSRANSDDGIEVDGEGAVVARNTANSNQDLGIEAVLGVVDHGGNRARRNGNPLQCTNVLCM